MNYLVDANLSPSIAEQLRADGREAIHVFDIGLATASDEVIYDHAEANGYVIITADTDFPTLRCGAPPARRWSSFAESPNSRPITTPPY